MFTTDIYVFVHSELSGVLLLNLKWFPMKEMKWIAEAAGHGPWAGSPPAAALVNRKMYVQDGLHRLAILWARGFRDADVYVIHR
jgi:hypothetical protein